ncbi:MAG: cbb3-type cytochrome c oxidase subunit I [Caldilineaceae bacterium]|nr:cbb3-type cytochrome c oxidase subunit I [Caldilineaceae bacterium]
MAVSTVPKTGVAARVEPVPLTQADINVADRIAGTSIFIAASALLIGVTLGVMQGLEHVGINLYVYVQPWVASYYHGLTMHGVLNALVWTTFFIVGFFTFAIVRSLNRPLRWPRLNVLALIVMVFGLLLAAIPMLSNNATVLYTFYPPMKADWTFYMGLTLVVVGSWMAGWGFYATLIAWRKEHPGQNQPFIALTISITMALWQLCTLGVAAEILFLLLPWSLGWVSGTDPLLGRTLFWFFGHPLVYFWLLPAYISWYAMLPKQTDGKMFSEPLARLVFWLFLLLSTPLGFHHQYADPGIPQAWKYIHAVLTYGVAFPSLLTAFTVIASLEVGARARGGKGYFGWIRRLNWGNPSYAAQNLAMVLFAFGGIGGITNASFNLNLAVHNTMWIPGHFHLTVGSATTLTFMGIAYWLVPKLTKRNLFAPKLALAQAWTWFIGMLLMGNGLHLLGLHFGAPRRSMLGSAPYASADWNPFLYESVVGVIFLSISATLFYVVIVGTLFNRRLTVPIEMPIAEPLDPTPAPKWLDNWTPWLAGAIGLVLLSYGPMLYQLIRDMTMWSQPWRVW